MYEDITFGELDVIKNLIMDLKLVTKKYWNI